VTDALVDHVQQSHRSVLWRLGACADQLSERDVNWLVDEAAKIDQLSQSLSRYPKNEMDFAATNSPQPAEGRE
jgi:hypothetical protein